MHEWCARAIMSNHLLTQHNLMEGRQGIARAPWLSY